MGLGYNTVLHSIQDQQQDNMTLGLVLVMNPQGRCLTMKG
jgi:hypothetical protein